MNYIFGIAPTLSTTKYAFMNGSSLDVFNDKELRFYLNKLYLEEWYNSKHELKLYNMETNKLLHLFVVKKDRKGEYYMYDKVTRKRYRDNGGIK